VATAGIQQSNRASAIAAQIEERVLHRSPMMALPCQVENDFGPPNRIEKRWRHLLQRLVQEANVAPEVIDVLWDAAMAFDHGVDYRDLRAFRPESKGQVGSNETGATGDEHVLLFQHWNHSSGS
jgi:hypothetical protein